MVNEICFRKFLFKANYLVKQTKFSHLAFPQDPGKELSRVLKANKLNQLTTENLINGNCI